MEIRNNINNIQEPERGLYRKGFLEQSGYETNECRLVAFVNGRGK